MQVNLCRSRRSLALLRSAARSIKPLSEASFTGQLTHPSSGRAVGTPLK
jgi:hypothetical protein